MWACWNWILRQITPPHVLGISPVQSWWWRSGSPNQSFDRLKVDPFLRLPISYTQMLKRIYLQSIIKINIYTGSLVSNRDKVSRIYRVLELEMRNIKGNCMFIGNEHLTFGPSIWIKVKYLSSTASVLNDGRISFEILSYYSKIVSFLENLK